MKTKIPNAAYTTPLAPPEQLSPGTLKIEKIYTFYFILKTVVIWDMPP
jgi:hypothetical protein